MNTIDVRTKDRQVTTCRCRRKVEWATDANTGRRLVFEGEIVALKTRRDEATWELVETVDRADLHQCPERPGAVQLGFEPGDDKRR